MASNVAAVPDKDGKAGPLSFLTPLSPAVSIYRPDASASVHAPTASSSSSATSPKLILLGTWMGARPAHIAKYVVRYQALFPSAQIVLMRTEQHHILQPGRAAREVAPAVPAIRAALKDSSPSSSSEPEPEILIHIWSNGGSGMLSRLYDAFRADAGRTGADPHLPLHATVFDSCPAPYHYGRGVTAFMIGAPGGVLVRWLLVLPVVHVLAIYAWVLRYVFDLDQMRDWAAAHNDPDGDGDSTGAKKSLSGSGSGSGARRARELRRTYIYSDEDALVGSDDVEAHAAQAEARGFVVRREKFVGSAHVAHVRVDEERYWRVVRETWEGRVST